MSENECGWIEIFIETEKEGFEPVSGIIYQCGVTGVMIEDSDDFTDFLENPVRDWDYIEDELVEKKIPVKMDRGATGTLANVLGGMLLAEYGASYDDVKKWGGKLTAVSNNDLVGLMQDGTINVALKVGPGEQSQIQEMVLHAGVKWLPVSEKVLKAVAEKTGLQVGTVPGTFYNGAVGQDIPCLVDTSVMIVRKGISDDDAYKLAKSLVEGHEELAAIQPTWKTLNPGTMTQNLVLPLHPGAEKYYREAGIIK